MGPIGWALVLCGAGAEVVGVMTRMWANRAMDVPLAELAGRQYIWNRYVVRCWISRVFIYGGVALMLVGWILMWWNFIGGWISQ